MEFEKLFGFTPFRLDWTKESIRDQVFYKSGHHMGHLTVKEDGTFEKDCEVYEAIDYLIKQNYVPQVKAITWGQLKEHPKANLQNFTLDHQSSLYLKCIPYHYTGGFSMDLVNDEGEKSETKTQIGSGFYHGCKGHWLLHDIKENGLNQPIQAVMMERPYKEKGELLGVCYDFHIHPGSVRSGVFGALDDEDMEIIVWDAYGYLDVDPITTEEWIEIFCKPQFNNQRPQNISVNYNYMNMELQCSGAMQDGVENDKHHAEYDWRKKGIQEFSKRTHSLFNGKPLNIYIGYDSRHNGVEEVQIESIRYAMKKSLSEEKDRFEPEIKLLDKSKIEEYTREYANQSTEFTYSRFLIPYLENYEGFSMFIDNDFIWDKPLWEMFYFLHPDNAVACVQYDYELEKMSTIKMGGEKNVMYPKKLWSSLMIFNNAHEDCKKLTPEVINTATGQYLHQFEWTDNIDRIPDKYILTEGMSDEGKRFHAVHYTRGGPWIDGMDTSEIKHLDFYEKKKNLLNK